MLLGDAKRLVSTVLQGFYQSNQATAASMALQPSEPRWHSATLLGRSVLSAPDECESHGKNLVTGAALEEDEYRAANPSGLAMLKAVDFVPPHETPSEEYPFALITGRTLYHFHTRTKTGRSPALQRSAPEVWVEISPSDARAGAGRETWWRCVRGLGVSVAGRGSAESGRAFCQGAGSHQGRPGHCGGVRRGGA